LDARARKAPPVPFRAPSKPNYGGPPDALTILHELAHQWFGDSISLTVWSDIWLNEGFATWCEWYWSEHRGGRTAQQEFDIEYSTVATNTRFWNPPPGVPGGPANLFDGTVYLRGAMTLQALRQKVGDATFFEIMRQWYARHRNGNVRTADFIALSEEIGALDLGDFFEVWLFTPGKPMSW
jgi:aminopeptidase N